MKTAVKPRTMYKSLFPPRRGLSRGVEDACAVRAGALPCGCVAVGCSFRGAGVAGILCPTIVAAMFKDASLSLRSSLMPTTAPHFVQNA